MHEHQTLRKNNSVARLFMFLLYCAAQLLDAVGETGVSLDPVYTLKALRGLLAEMAGNPGRFAGSRVLFIHTGGWVSGWVGGCRYRWSLINCEAALTLCKIMQ